MLVTNGMVSAILDLRVAHHNKFVQLVDDPLQINYLIKINLLRLTDT
jgi:hypothetical protein